jgi:hypothetical protein
MAGFLAEGLGSLASLERVKYYRSGAGSDLRFAPESSPEFNSYSLVFKALYFLQVGPMFSGG